MIQFTTHELHSRILLVENVVHMAKIMREMLLVMGFREVHRVTNVVHAYQSVVKCRPGLIIAEANLYPCGGIQLCKALRIASDSPAREVPFLLTLTEPTGATVAQARDAGVHFVIAKPLPAAGLATKIAALLRNPLPFIAAGAYVGPDRRRREAAPAGRDRRSRTVRTTDFQLPAHQVMDIDPDVLSGVAATPPEFTAEDNHHPLRPPAQAQAPRPVRKVMVTQLALGMELAEPVTENERVVLIPGGIMVNQALKTALCQLAKRGRIANVVRVLE